MPVSEVAMPHACIKRTEVKTVVAQFCSQFAIVLSGMPVTAFHTLPCLPNVHSFVPSYFFHLEQVEDAAAAAAADMQSIIAR